MFSTYFEMYQSSEVDWKMMNKEGTNMIKQI